MESQLLSRWWPNRSSHLISCSCLSLSTLPFFHSPLSSLILSVLLSPLLFPFFPLLSTQTLSFAQLFSCFHFLSPDFVSCVTLLLTRLVLIFPLFIFAFSHLTFHLIFYFASPSFISFRPSTHTSSHIFSYVSHLSPLISSQINSNFRYFDHATHEFERIAQKPLGNSPDIL